MDEGERDRDVEEDDDRSFYSLETSFILIMAILANVIKLV